jgi:hypothetical protein
MKGETQIEREGTGPVREEAEGGGRGGRLSRQGVAR